MAKVTGPLMSMDASGKFGGALVFGKWKGRPTVRQLVTPSNPQTANQVKTRNAIRVMGEGQKFTNVTAMKRAGETLRDEEELTNRAPSGQAWNGFYVKSGIGADMITYDAARSAYTAFTAPEKSAWSSAAASLVPAIPNAAQGDTGGGYTTPMDRGEVYFHHCYALYSAGVMDAAPSAVPPTYA